MSIVTDEIFELNVCKREASLDEKTKMELRAMGIPTTAMSEVDAGFYDLPDVCFFCGQRFAGFPAIMWSGHRPDHGKGRLQLWLHVECAKALCLRLMRDWNELKNGKEMADQLFRQAHADHQAEQNKF